MADLASRKACNAPVARARARLDSWHTSCSIPTIYSSSRAWLGLFLSYRGQCTKAAATVFSSLILVRIHTKISMDNSCLDEHSFARWRILDHSQRGDADPTSKAHAARAKGCTGFLLLLWWMAASPPRQARLVEQRTHTAVRASFPVQQLQYHSNLSTKKVNKNLTPKVANDYLVVWAHRSNTSGSFRRRPSCCCVSAHAGPSSLLAPPSRASFRPKNRIESVPSFSYGFSA